MDIIVGLFQSETLLELIVRIAVAIYLVFIGVIQIPKKKCNPELNLIVKNSVEKAEKIFRIKSKDLLYEQMSMAEVAQESIMFLMREAYSGISKSGRDIKHYNKILFMAEKETKNMIRKFFKENHFTSRTESEFSNYVDDKIEYLINRVTFILNEEYVDAFFIVKRKEVYEKNFLIVVPATKEKWRKMFYEAREIARAKEKEIKNLG